MRTQVHAVTLSSLRDLSLAKLGVVALTQRNLRATNMRQNCCFKNKDVYKEGKHTPEHGLAWDLKEEPRVIGWNVMG